MWFVWYVWRQLLCLWIGRMSYCSTMPMESRNESYYCKQISLLNVPERCLAEFWLKGYKRCKQVTFEKWRVALCQAEDANMVLLLQQEKYMNQRKEDIYLLANAIKRNHWVRPSQLLPHFYRTASSLKFEWPNLLRFTKAIQTWRFQQTTTMEMVQICFFLQ